MVDDPEDSRDLLLPLARAQDGLARLEATAAAASEAVREGLRARLAFREAAGWLAHQGHWIHPTDLALRDAGLTGSYAAARLGQRLPSVLPATTQAAEEAQDAPEDQDIALALTVARLWRRLGEQRTWRPLENLEALAPLGEGGPPEVLAERLRLLWPPDDLPPLVVAGIIARDWQGTGRRDRLSLAGIFLAACVWRANGGEGLPLWSAPVQRLHRPRAATAPRLARAVFGRRGRGRAAGRPGTRPPATRRGAGRHAHAHRPLAPAGSRGPGAAPAGDHRAATGGGARRQPSRRARAGRAVAGGRRDP